MRYRLHLSYDGAQFGGWQKQNAGPPTVQGTLEAILKRITGQPIRVISAGRTDAGVHAVLQVAHFDTEKDLSPGWKTLRSLNALAPDGLVVNEIQIAPSDFHSIASAVSKTYIYRIWNHRQLNVFSRRRTLHVPKPLDLEKLNRLSEVLVGEMDFASFRTRGTDNSTTVRRITEAYFTKKTPNLVEFRISGEGFLKQMVRNIVGTLLHLERNEGTIEELKEILAAADRQKAKATAPPHGLYLLRVTYPEALDNQCRKI